MPPARAEAGLVASLPVARERGCLPLTPALGLPCAAPGPSWRAPAPAAAPPGPSRRPPTAGAAILGDLDRARRAPPLRVAASRGLGLPSQLGGVLRGAAPILPGAAERAEQPPRGLAGRRRVLGAVAGRGTPHPVVIRPPRQRSARPRPSGPHPQRVADAGRCRSRSAAPGAVALEVMAWPSRGAPLDAWRPRSCACGATAPGPWRATAQPRPPAHARIAQRSRRAGPDWTLGAWWLAGSPSPGRRAVCVVVCWSSCPPRGAGRRSGGRRSRAATSRPSRPAAHW
jgi:hypothetical protein